MIDVNLELRVDGVSASASSLAALATAAERSGFAGVAVTDHPAPSRKWLERGGHQTFDPFAALAFLGAVTERIRLQTYLVVLPYRNPLLLARSVATVDRLSGGRLTLVVGTGYLRSEFAALGVPFDERNARFDEAIAVLTSVWTEPSFRYDGMNFVAVDQSVVPGPIQLPHPPIWIGGASPTSRQRAARVATGWSPLVASDDLARSTRSTPLRLGDLADAWAEVTAAARAENRVDPMAFQVGGLGTIASSLADITAHQRLLAELEAAGVTHLILSQETGPLDVRLAAIESYGRTFLRL